MKKVFTLVLSLFVITVGFSQIKHNKFTTLVTIDTINPPNFTSTGITEIKDNSGYFLSNFYDNQAGGFNPFFLKLDVDGNVVFDTIYDFIPNNPGGSSYFVDATTSNTSHTALYSTLGLQAQFGLASPYLLNVDFNGGINWSVGFSNDTVDIEPQKIINTQDGGYLVAGKVYDYYNSGPPAGIAIKLDNMGMLQWHKLYTNNDTMNLTFSDGIQTNNGGYFFVGEASNQAFASRALTSSDYLVTMVRTDNLGAVVWNKGIVFPAPINNEQGFSDITTGMINDSNAYVAFTVKDSSTTSEYIAVASVNINTGAKNWTNYYTLPLGESLVSRQSTPDGKGNILITGVDFNNNTNALLKIDAAGNLIDIKRYALGSYSNNPHGLIKTLDGGIVQANYIAQNQVLIVKTDKTLNPSCPDIDSTYFTLTSVSSMDTSYFGIVDSVYTLNGFVALTMSAGSPVSSGGKDSLICSCTNAISGTVLDGITPVNGAKVYLFRKGIVPKPWAPIDSIVTTALGTYAFNYVPTDSFLVKVNPNPIFNPNSMVSYHKHLDTCYKWESAGVFHVHCDSSSIIKDVTLITPPPLTGSSGLNGYIFEYTGSFSKQQPGDPVPGIGITVEQSPGGIIGGSTSGGNGYYNLSNINNGTTYIISADYPGLPNDSIYTMSISLNDTILDSLNFYIDSTGIYIVGSVGTGISSFNAGDLSIDVFPNPSSDNFNIDIFGTKSENIQLDLANSVGKLIYSESESIKNGLNKLVIKTTDFAQGIYFLKIRQGSNLYIKKLIKQ